MFYKPPHDVIFLKDDSQQLSLRRYLLFKFYLSCSLFPVLMQEKGLLFQHHIIHRSQDFTINIIICNKTDKI